MGYRNEDPFAPWNDPSRRSDPFAAWNDPMLRDDPFAPWNSPLASGEETRRYLRREGYEGQGEE